MLEEKIHFMSKVLSEYMNDGYCKKETQIDIFNLIVRFKIYRENDSFILNKEELELIEEALWYYGHKHLCTEWNTLRKTIDILKEEN